MSEPRHVFVSELKSGEVVSLPCGCLIKVATGQRRVDHTRPLTNFDIEGNPMRDTRVMVRVESCGIFIHPPNVQFEMRSNRMVYVYEMVNALSRIEE